MPRSKKQAKPTEKPAYFLEWESSKVAPEIIEKNVKFVKGNDAYESLLWALGQDCRTNTGQLRQKYLYRYNHLYSGGWLCTTLDPFANFSRTEWGCLKPVEPKEKDGKIIKYEHPPSTPTRAFYLEIGEPQYQKISQFWEIGKNGDFWPWVQSQTSLPVVITEGAKKAGSLLTAGYAAVALPGVNNGVVSYEGEKDLSPDLKAISQSGREIILAFDEDARFKTQKMVANATLDLGKVFESYGCRVTVACWDSNDGKGIDDWIAAKGETELHNLIGERISLVEYREKKIRKVRKITHNAHFLDFLRECELDHKLKYNMLSLEVELDGKQFDEPEWFYMWFCDTYSVEVSEKIFFQSVLYFAYTNRYHPVRDYLESVADLPPVDLDRAAERYFGLTDPISNILLKRWLIGAVARVNRPGCKLQGALILYGDPGVGKSTFFEKLGGPFYGGDVDDIKGKDNLLKQHNYWLIECQEFDQITSKTQANALKSWITTDTDNIRPPYGRKASPHKRGFAIGGSCNNVEFLSDPTGSRRFWILDVGNRFVNHHLLDTERDNLWAAAVQAYNAGERWHLTAEEEAAINQGNKRYEIADDWTSIVEQYCSIRNAVTASDILTQALDFKDKEITRRESMRITNILTALKWRKLGQRRELIDGRYRRASYWVRDEIMTAINDGKLLSDAELSDIQEFDLNQVKQDPVAIPQLGGIATEGGIDRGIDTPNASDSNGFSEVSIPAIPFEEKKRKEKTNLTTEDKPEPEIDQIIESAAQEGITLDPDDAREILGDKSNRVPHQMDPWRQGRINQINIYKQELGLSNEDLRDLSLKLFKKEYFAMLTNQEIKELDDHLYLKIMRGNP